MQFSLLITLVATGVASNVFAQNTDYTDAEVVGGEALADLAQKAITAVKSQSSSGSCNPANAKIRTEWFVQASQWRQIKH